MSGICSKIAGHAKKHKDMIHDEEKNQSIETDPEIIQMRESVGWDLNTAIRTMIHMFKKTDEKLNMLSTDRKYKEYPN